MAEEEDLLIVCSLVPILLPAEPRLQPLHQLNGAQVGSNVKQAAVERKLALFLGKPA